MRRLFVTTAVLCAVCGLVLAASAMPMVASESPASDFLDGDSGERTAEGMDTAVAQDEHAAEGAEIGGQNSLDSDIPGGALVERTVDSENPDVEGTLYGLAALLSALDGDSSAGNGGSVDEAGFGDAEEGSTDESSLDNERGDDGGTDDEPADESTADADGGDDGETDDELADESTADADNGGDDSSLEDAIPGLSDGVVLGGLVVGGLLLIAYVFATRSNPIATLLSIPGRLVSVALSAVVACSQALERAIRALGRLRSVAELPGLVMATLVHVFHTAGKRVRNAGSSLFGGGVDDSAPDEEEYASARQRIRQAFESVIDASRMPRGRVATATPTDVARSARDAGAPDDPVETITHTFRDVEYGDRDPEAHLERTTTAHNQLRSALEATPDEDGADDRGADTDE
ncbi:DUF4129 domain-containing protein [Natronorubrum sp. A-ect3]|uniref:DUF4129 domain-containing protein n=1 Tax=Natronorubrum sp. A-ect3 TaxID=3242698 RepID=UPI00359D2900